MLLNSIISTNYPGRRYKCGKSIDVGGESTVYFGEFQGEQCAIKKYKKPICEREKQFNRKLIKLSDNFYHLVRIYDYIDQPEQILIMELANDNLENLMKQNQFQKLDVHEKNKLFQQIVEGVWEIDSLGYYHRDIKPQNILYFQQKHEIILKLSDYGIVKRIDDERQTMGVGTYLNQAPEQLRDSYDKSINIWQLGIIWFIMMGVEDIKKIGQMRFQSQEIINRQIQQKCQNMDMETQQILIQMLQIDPQQRINLKDLRYYLIRLIQFEEIQIKLQGWQNIQNDQGLEKEFENFIDKEDLNNFQKILQLQQNLIQQIKKSPFQRKDLHRDLLFQSKEILNAYGRLTINLKQKSKRMIIGLNSQVLELKSVLKSINLQLEKLIDQKQQNQFNQKIQQYSNAVNIIEKTLLGFIEKIENFGSIQSYENLKNFKLNLLSFIVNQKHKMDQLNQNIEQISVQILDVIEKEKNQPSILKKGSKEFEEVSLIFKQSNEIWLKNYMLCKLINQEQLNLQKSMEDLQSLVDQGNEDLVLLQELQIYDKNQILKVKQDQEKFKIKQIEDLISYCQNHIVTLNNEEGERLMEIGNNDLTTQFVMIEELKETLDVSTFQEQVNNFCQSWKEKKEILIKHYKDLQKQLKYNNNTQIILKYLQITIKLHNLKRLKFRLIESDQGKRQELIPQKKLFFNYEQIFVEKNPELKDIDSKIKYYEKLTSEMQVMKENDEQIKDEQINQEIDLELQNVLEEIKEKNKRKLQLKFRSLQSIEIIMQKVYSKEFNQGFILQLLMGEQEDHYT